MIILKGIAREVQSAVSSLLGTSESKKILGKGFGGDQTMLIDEVAEEAIVNFLKYQKIDCTFIGEEHGVQKIGKKPTFYLIADAVDGTTNATRGISFVSASLALSPTDDMGCVEAALVTNLFNGEMYEAEKGKGAKYDGEKIKTSETAFLNDAVLGIDISRAPNSVELTAPFMKIAKSVRSFGSASLEICNVASGRFDAYVDLRGMLRPLDIAAAILIVKEAGGIILQPHGKGFDGYPLSELNHFSIIAAANEKIRHEIAYIISQSQD
jgi:myo-inositol-1(or 4)-monophosphatase